MPEIAILGSSSSHGGEIISSCIKTRVNGHLIARVGDLHSCPIAGHGVTEIESGGSDDTFVEGANIAVVGSVAGCGAVIIDGSLKEFVN